MKLFAKLLLAVLVIGALLPFTVLKDKNGNTLMNFSDLKMPGISTPKIPDLSDLSLPKSDDESDGEKVDGKDIFYKWYDANGQLQFTTSPPAQGIEYTVKGFDPNTNVIQAVKVKKEVEPVNEGVSEKQPDKKISADDVGNPYSKESVEKLFDDAQNIEKLLNDRIKKQQSAIQ